MSELFISMSIGDQDATDLLASMLDLTMDDERRLAACLRLRVALTRSADGAWQGLDDDRVTLWKQISVSVEIRGEESELFRGYIVQVNTHFEHDLDSGWVELLALDESCLMAVEEKVRDWPDKSDSDIATEIFNAYGLTPRVEDTQVVHPQTLGTILQRESDIAFLHRLAARNGYECCVRSGEGWFRSMDLTRAPRPTLCVHFGEQTNVISFDASVRGIGPTAVNANLLDVVAKEVQSIQFTASSAKALGLVPALKATTPPAGDAKLLLRGPLALSLAELERRCCAVGEDSTWFIRAEFEVDAAQYGAVLFRGDRVPVRGVGEALSGHYYVAAIRYRLSAGRLVQRATGIRNAQAPTSAADFAGGQL